MILKLRDDYKAKMGERYSLQDFHDRFISLGPLPLPLIRKAMLGEVGGLFLWLSPRPSITSIPSWPNRSRGLQTLCAASRSSRLKHAEFMLTRFLAYG